MSSKEGESASQTISGDSTPAPLPDETNKMTDWGQLNKMILDYYDKVRLTKEEYLKVVEFKQYLEQEIGKTMPGGRFEIGGSFSNGFGNQDSDLDLCFMLEDHDRPKDFDELKTLTDLSEILTSLGLNNQIIRSNVNIIKCDANNSVKRSIDISCYNTLALYNTKLLAKYCEWEPKRLPALGVWVKKWAKCCSIGDAFEGTLSSYAWMIILIHYLQNCNPPVLPCLQEEFRTDATEVVPHLKCDVYFHESVEENWSSNNQSVAELFAGFLTHIRSFDYENLIIQIRRKKELTKTEKNRWGKMCVEDPFLLSHNLAQKRGKSVIKYICNTVENSEKTFLMAEEFDAEKILKSCRLETERETVKKCELCDRRDLCKDGCENRYKRNPKWRSSEERAERIRSRRLRNEKRKARTGCSLCGRMGLCKDGCENRYERHPKWRSTEERAEKKRLNRLKKEEKNKFKCPLCGKNGLCQDDCEKRYERHPDWISREERVEKQKFMVQQKLLKRQGLSKNYLRTGANQMTYDFATLWIDQNKLEAPLQNSKVPLKTSSKEVSAKKANPTIIEGPNAPKLHKEKRRFNGNRTFHNSKLQETSLQTPPDFSNTDDFPSL